jgi:hypothetical protein
MVEACDKTIKRQCNNKKQTSENVFQTSEINLGFRRLSVFSSQCSRAGFVGIMG